MNAAPLLKRFPRTACRLSPGCSDFSEPLGKGSDRSLKDKNPQKQTPDGVELLKQFVQGMSHWHRRAALQNNPPPSGSAAPGDPKRGPACPAWPKQKTKQPALCVSRTKGSPQLSAQDPPWTSLPPITAAHAAHPTCSIPQLCPHCSSPRSPTLRPTPSHPRSTVMAAHITPDTHRPQLPPRPGSGRPSRSFPFPHCLLGSVVCQDLMQTTAPSSSAGSTRALGRHTEPDSHRALTEALGEAAPVGAAVGPGRVWVGRSRYGCREGLRMPQGRFLLGSARRGTGMEQGGPNLAAAQPSHPLQSS